MGSHSQPIDAPILLIGAGKMGGALLNAWLHAGINPETVTVAEVNAVALPAGVKRVSSLDSLSQNFDCIVLAVKPQSMDAVMGELAVWLHSFPAGEGVLLLSIAAGKTLGYFAKHLPNAPVVRAMPNTPALIRKGITVLIANDKMCEAQKRLADSLMQAAGETVWLDDESKMDAVTAISGSGPAYVFLFLEALMAAGVAQGLSEEVAKRLALQTMRGSVKLAIKSGEPLATLRQNVTSPGGTTEAALGVLMKDDALQTLMQEAVSAAAKRAKELA